MQLSLPLVNRTHFRDTKHFHLFALRHKTLYFLYVWCVNLQVYLIGLSEKVPLNKLGIVERHKHIQVCYFGNHFLNKNYLWVILILA